VLQAMKASVSNATATGLRFMGVPRRFGWARAYGSDNGERRRGVDRRM